MKKSLFVLAFICILFGGCSKEDIGGGKEDLSYLYVTYQRYDQNNNTYETRRTFDRNKETGYQYFINGQLYQENKNYSYDGLNASWDAFTYQIELYNNEANHQHVECEYLDNTYKRIKYQKTETHYANPQNDYVSEAYYEYDGKKKVGYKGYSNGILSSESHDFNYDGLHCTYTTTYYSSGEVTQENSYIIDYLDDTYLRQKSYTRTRQLFGEGQAYYTNTLYRTYDFDGKKIIGSHSYSNGKLSGISRDYHYDGLTCHYYADSYNSDGEVSSTTLYEVIYLK